MLAACALREREPETFNGGPGLASLSWGFLSYTFPGVQFSETAYRELERFLWPIKNTILYSGILRNIGDLLGEEDFSFVDQGVSRGVRQRSRVLRGLYLRELSTLFDDQVQLSDDARSVLFGLLRAGRKKNVTDNSTIAEAGGSGEGGVPSTASGNGDAETWSVVMVEIGEVIPETQLSGEFSLNRIFESMDHLVTKGWCRWEKGLRYRFASDLHEECVESLEKAAK